MSFNVTISVIIPCYNSAKYIVETLDSVKNQTFNDFEIIIVNDGSTDNSEEIINKYIHENKSINIVLVVQDNKGLSGARNTGAKHAKGEYIVFIDSDDKIHPNYLKKSIFLLENDTKLQIIYSEAEFFDAKKGRWKLPYFKINSFLIQNCIPAFAVLRTKTFVNFNGFDENLKFTEDWELWIRIIKEFPDCVYRIPEILFYYRKRANQRAFRQTN